MATTIRDAYHEYTEKCGATPPRSLAELRDYIHARRLRYEQLDEAFWDEMFESGWAYALDESQDA